MPLRERRDALAYDQMSMLGRVSFWLSRRAVTSRLRPGSWLDLLSGSRASLQRYQTHDRRISELHALDHELDDDLAALGIQGHEQYVECTLPFAEATFDNLTINNGLEHLWHPQEILDECFRIMRPGALLQIVVPTWFGKPFLEFLAFTLRDPQALIEMNDHKMYYDERSLWPMLVRAGFLPEHINLRRVKLGCSLHATAVKAGDQTASTDGRR